MVSNNTKEFFHCLLKFKAQYLRYYFNPLKSFNPTYETKFYPCSYLIDRVDVSTAGQIAGSVRKGYDQRIYALAGERLRYNFRVCGAFQYGSRAC